MLDSPVILVVSFVGFFLALTSLLQNLSRKSGFPYSIALLLAGLIAQYLFQYIGFVPPVDVSYDIIFFVILPLLLFESALHINFHQFKLQFKTITFLTTFGVLVSTFVVGVGLLLFTKVPFGVALLFGALISATDPIAVLALFKTLGVPKRLQLLADGESMFNDATAVIVFRTIVSFVVIQEVVNFESIVAGMGNFLYVFIGSIIFGAAFGYIISKFISQIEEDRFVEITLTLVLAISSFIIAEEAFALSGVIATVAAGISLGNFGKTKISGGVLNFMDELWEYVGFISVSLVFFFAALTMDFSLVTVYGYRLLIVVGVVLVARSVSTYASFGISNRLKLFKNEPNVPLSWQHIMNWGGLRGVIPLVLVYSLPNSFVYKQPLLSFTLAVLLFTLLVNGLTIKKLLLKLRVHLKSLEEEIIKEEENVFVVEQQKEKLKSFKGHDFNKKAAQEVEHEITTQARIHKKRLRSLATTRELRRSLIIQTLMIERETLETLFKHGYVTEKVYYAFERELDLQDDALHYPEVSSGRGYRKGGYLDEKDLIHSRFEKLLRKYKRFSWVSTFLRKMHKTLIEERLMLLKVRIISSDNVLDYLRHVAKFFKGKPSALKTVAEVKALHSKVRDKNRKEFAKLEKIYPRISLRFQKSLMRAIVLGKI